MSSVARHLGLAVLVLGACALMGAAPKTDPTKTAKAKTAKVATTKSTKTAVATTHKAKPAAAKAPTAMRIERNTDAESVGLMNGGVIPYVEPQVQQVGEPVLTHKPDGSLELFLNGTGEESVVMTIGPDGKRHTRCVEAPSKAAKAARVAPAPQREER